MAVLLQSPDFTFMEEKKAKLFRKFSNAIDDNYVEKCNTLRSAQFQAEKAGMVDSSVDEGCYLSRISVS